jgi:hypothetical protein
MSLDDEGAAEFVMHGGLQSLAHDAKLPADQRRVIEEVKKLRQWQDEVRSEVENELHPKQTPDWVGQGRATGPIDAVAEKLVEAAYELFGRPPEAGGEYIHTVIRETDVPGYFRKMLQIAEGARSRDLWQYFEKVRNHDAEMVMNAGLEYLSRQATLPADERRLVEEIKKFQEWHLAIQHEIENEWNELSGRAAALDGYSIELRARRCSTVLDGTDRAGQGALSFRLL